MKTNLLQKNIPKGWEIKKIKDLLDFEQPTKYIVESSSYTPDGKTPVLTANKSFVLGYTNETDGVYANTPAIIFDDFTTDSKYVDFPFKIKSSAIKILTNKDEDTDLKFVYEIMKSFTFPIANHKRHYISQYQELDIVVPLIKEQKKIADILSSVDEEIQKVEEMISVTEKLKQGLMQKIFSKKYPKKRIIDVAQVVSGATPKTSVSTYWGGNLVWVTPKDLSIIKSKYIYDSARAITETGFKNCSAVKIPAGSLIMSSRAPIGYLAINKTEATTNQGCKSIIPNKDLNIEYLYYYLDFNMDNMRRLGSGSTFAEVGKTAVENFVIAVPEIAEQKNIADIFSSVDEKNTVNQKLKSKLLELKKGLVSDLLSGSKRVKI
ncbi:MAG: restriction endonuclease subunit S [Candidatus Cloacimonetes bacterium]|nr:restriction endonuclease subunit S [Candidatus Cloacimonadota bacterium]